MEIVVECQSKLIESQNKIIDGLAEQIKDLKKEILELKINKDKDQDELYRLKLVADQADKLRNIITKNAVKVNSSRGTREYFRACCECGLLHDDRFNTLIKCELCDNRGCNEIYGCLRKWKIEKNGRFDVPYCPNH